MRSLLLLLTAVLCACFSTTAQDLKWATNIGGPHESVGSRMVTDAQQNLYLTGHYGGIIDLDPGPNVAIPTVYGALANGFVAKYTPDGDYQWHLDFGGSGTTIPRELRVDANGNVIVTGEFDGTMDMDPDTSVFNITSAGNKDGFVAKYDNTGQLLWAHAIGSMFHDETWGCEVDANGNVYITGFFLFTMDADPGAGTHTLVNQGIWDSYVIKFDPAGNFVWARQFGNAEIEIGNTLAIDSDGSLYCSGSFRGTTDFDPGAGTFNLTSAGDYDAYVVKLDENGDFHWAFSVGGVESDFAEQIRLDTTGHLYLFGTFEAAAEFDPGAGTDTLTALTGPGGANNYFVARYDTTGAHQWAHGFAGNSHQEALGDLAVDLDGNAYLTGTFFSTFDADPGAGIDSLTPDTFPYELFLTKLAPDGSYQGSHMVHTNGNFDESNGLATDCEGNVYLTGAFALEAVFDSVPGIADTLDNATLSSAFFARYGPDPCFDDTLHFADTICAGDSLLIFGSWQTQAATYTQISTHLCGCDTLQQFALTVLPNAAGNDTLTICAGDSALIAGTWQTTAGTYTDTFTNALGCDSSVSMLLQVQPTAAASLSVSICPGDSVLAAGSWQTTAGTYSDSLQTTNGCDSIVTTQITLLPIYADTLTATICNGDSLLFGGNWRFNQGIYTDSLQALSGCDSVVVLDLILAPTFADTTTASICTNDSIFLAGSWTNVAGWYTDSLTAANGCDSVIHTELTVLPVPAPFSDTARFCAGDSVLLGGTWYFMSTQVVDTLLAASGCDSVVTTVVTVDSLPVVSVPQTDTACTNATVPLPAGLPAGGMWTGFAIAGNQFSTQNIPSDSTVHHYYTFTDANGCSATDSLAWYVQNCIGIAEMAPITMRIYPNPSSGSFWLAAGFPVRTNALIYNTMGQLVHQQPLLAQQPTHVLDLSNQAAGMYVLVVEVAGRSWKQVLVLEGGR